MGMVVWREVCLRNRERECVKIRTVVSISRHGVTRGVTGLATARGGMIEVVHKRAHGVAVIGREFTSLFGQPRRRLG